MPHTILKYSRHAHSRAEQDKSRFHMRVILFIVCCIISFIAGVAVHNYICEPEVVEERVINVELIKEFQAPITLSRPVLEIPTVTYTEVTSSEVSYSLPEEPVEEEEAFESFYEYTEEELDLLARLIEAEVGAENYDAKLRVGSVVMNRVTATNFPNTIREVIYQKNQFSVTFIRINGVIMIDRPASEDSIKAAREILDHGSILPHDVQVFYAVGCTEKWVTSREVYEVCDKTVFAYIYSKGAN